MTASAMQSTADEAPGFATHEVMNQPGSLQGYDAYSDDGPLVDAVRTFGADWASGQLKHAGTLVGSEKVQDLARQANRYLPEFNFYYVILIQIYLVMPI